MISTPAHAAPQMYNYCVPGSPLGWAHSTASCAGVLEQCRGQSNELFSTITALAGAAGQQNKSRPAVRCSDLWEVPQPRGTVCPQVQTVQGAGLCPVPARLEA